MFSVNTVTSEMLSGAQMRLDIRGTGKGSILLTTVVEPDFVYAVAVDSLAQIGGYADAAARTAVVQHMHYIAAQLPDLEANDAHERIVSETIADLGLSAETRRTLLRWAAEALALTERFERPLVPSDAIMALAACFDLEGVPEHTRTQMLHMMREAYALCDRQYAPLVEELQRLRTETVGIVYRLNGEGVEVCYE